MSAAATILSRPLCTLAFCWRLDRKDGVSIGLVSHDRDVTVGGFLYAAAPGLLPSSIRQTDTLDAAIMDVEGALSSDSLSADDLRDGRWDGAALMLHLTEWEDPGALWHLLARGTLGAVRQMAGAFTAALSGAQSIFDGPVAPMTSPTCRASLGDARCRVDMAVHRRMARVDTVTLDAIAITGIDGSLYAGGQLRWLEGPACGLRERIIDGGAGTLLLSEPVRHAVAPQTRVLIEEGCDRTIATCSARFGNAINFRGEPYLPGTDLLTRYPGA